MNVIDQDQYLDPFSNSLALAHQELHRQCARLQQIVIKPVHESQNTKMYVAPKTQTEVENERTLTIKNNNNNRQTERQTDRQTDRRMDRHTKTYK